MDFLKTDAPAEGLGRPGLRSQMLGKGAGVKRFFMWWLSGILNLMSDIEFSLGANVPHRPQFIRGLYFRAMQVRRGRHAFIGSNFHVRRPGNLVLGDRCAIGSYTRIWNYAPVTIGEDFLSAAGLTINSGGHDVSTMEPFSKPVSIGNRVWCGVNVTILAGVSIGDDVVIGAGSVVTADLPSNSVAVGVPAKVVRTVERDLAKFWRPRWD